MDFIDPIPEMGTKKSSENHICIILDGFYLRKNIPSNNAASGLQSIGRLFLSILYLLCSLSVQFFFVLLCGTPWQSHKARGNTVYRSSEVLKDFPVFEHQVSRFLKHLFWILCSISCGDARFFFLSLSDMVNSFWRRTGAAVLLGVRLEYGGFCV